MNIVRYFGLMLMLMRCLWLKVKFGSVLRLRGLPRIGRIGFFNIRAGGCIELGRTYIDSNVTLSVPGGKLRIGDDVLLNVNCYVVCRGEMTIGDGCLIGPGVCIVDHNHAFDETGVRNDLKIGKIVIGKKCWIGANAVILKDTEIGEGCIVGAGAVVQGVIPAHTIVKSSRDLDIVRIGLI